MLGPLGVQVVGIDEVAPGWTVVEDGATFADNARLKACDLARRSGLPVLGDDSGLEVDALAGRPGVRSARYAGEHASDGENVALLLRELAKRSRRCARGRVSLRVGTGLARRRGRRGRRPLRRHDRACSARQ